MDASQSTSTGTGGSSGNGKMVSLANDNATMATVVDDPKQNLNQAIVALKKVTQLIKYCRKRKPKLCPFRIFADETTLIWFSRGQERNLKLSSVSRIIPGQRTAVFRRYLQPEKDYLSFSLLYNNGERSLDLDGSDIIQNGSPLRVSFDFACIAHGRVSIDLNSSRESPLNLVGSYVASECTSMQLRTNPGDGFRISVSSTPSCSSGGSGPDDIESLGDVYLWGEVSLDGTLHDGSMSPVPIKTDVLTPRPLESNVVLDVHQISCGVRHVALVTRQGEVFTWGEESGGRLGHGIDKDFSRPRLVEFLAINNVGFVACGEYHSCAVSTTGDLFTWGDGAHNAGLLGHGTDVSHWIPKRVNGPLEGLQVLSVACGTWHSALSTSNGKLFTFGDGTFGVLGHGDRQSVSYPREVQLLSGLKTIKVACGVWHTAAIVEVAGQAGSSISSRKLFTWGDGDKNRLGHGNKETYLLPTCVSSLIDYNFQQLGCGHTMTVALTTSGHVFTMGGTSHGQLGNPSSDGKTPCLVQDKLVGEFVEEISCGANHVAVLTSRSEVFTWGKGANGRLGHGDTEDRKTPTLVEALKDRHVKNISCGSNFTTSICIHKWVSGADQSVCSGCRQAFGFTRKRHNCYNCGLVHCHACSSRKAFRATLAPIPGKPHRVCDACYAKLKAAEAGNSSNYNRKVTTTRRSINSRDFSSRVEVRSSRVLLYPTTEPVKYLEVRSGRSGTKGTKSDYSSMVRASQVPSLLQLKDIAFPSSLSAIQNALKPVTPTSPHTSVNSRTSSLYARKPSPPRSATPVFSKSVIDNIKKSNELLTQEVTKLHGQVKSLKQKCDVQDAEMQQLRRDAKAATSFAEGQSSKCKVAKELVKSFTEQLKAITEKLPTEDSENEIMKSLHVRAEDFLNMTNETTSETSSSLRTSLEREHRHTNHLSHEGGDTSPHSDKPSISRTREDETQPSSEDGSKSHRSLAMKAEKGKEVIEQFEPGVYVTLIQLQNGTRIFRRVKFSKRRFSEQQAEEWWNNNKDRLLKTYSVPEKVNPAQTGSSSTPAPAPVPAPAEESSHTVSSS
ncbi:putative E3 ubiquitin-protein ligase HERC1 [Morus notabilis]|uniref:Putative E3 ubiquitin-protein ligase HERC1 n=1 Tax=Morus notabilis TaxID=981085 RepID=W9QU68_9ROSA|nr:putative E3 ubiquitin-protein ligase HERC1 [Morus notabilis]